MASFNRVILMGNLTRDPELRYIPSGMAVTDIGLAVNDRRKNSAGEWVDETTFVDITLWGRSAEVACEYLKKGSSCFIEGRLKLDSWEGNDGQKRNKLKVIGEVLRLVGGRGEGGGRSEGGSGRAEGGGRGDGESGYRSGNRGGGQRGAARHSPASNDAGHYDDFGDGPGGAPQDDDIPF